MRRTVSLLAVALLVNGAPTARADELQLHGEVGGVHAVGNPQASEFSFGGEVEIAGEWVFRRVIGLQAELSFLGVAQGDAPSNPAIARPGVGIDVGGMWGVRLHPFGVRHVAGLWLDGNVGVAVTGGTPRPSFDTHLGYDVRVGRGRFDVGPFVGYTQVLSPQGTLVPGDAHFLTIGAHVAFGASSFPVALAPRGDRDHDGVLDEEDACPDEPGIHTDDPKTNGCPRRDRDHDGVFDEEDACPDEPGIHTDDPKTNGCPRRDRDHDSVFDDEDACPDVPGVATANPRTNGCPRSDRDNDAIPDEDDACPDIPGLPTSDPKTNGCPKAGDQVRLVGDKIVLDDIIHFDNDSPRIRHPSWPICRKVANFIQNNPDVLEVDIEGHADETGTEEHNVILSRNRAEAVKRLLVEFGVDPKRITTHAYGESRPKVPGHAEEQLRQNRRVEFTVTRSRARASELVPAVPPPTDTP